MFKKHDAAKAAGVSAPQKEKAPSGKTEGASKKHLHSICKSVLLALQQPLFEALIVTLIVLAVLGAASIYALLIGGAV